MDLRREAAIAGFEASVVFEPPLDLGLPGDAPRACAVPQPELVLQRNERCEKYGDHGLHRPIRSPLPRRLSPITIGRGHSPRLRRAATPARTPRAIAGTTPAARPDRRSVRRSGLAAGDDRGAFGPPGRQEEAGTGSTLSIRRLPPPACPACSIRSGRPPRRPKATSPISLPPRPALATGPLMSQHPGEAASPGPGRGTPKARDSSTGPAARGTPRCG